MTSPNPYSSTNTDISHDLTSKEEQVIPEKANREGDSQALPTINDEQDIQSRVIEDIVARRKLGIKRYGTTLQPHNGRDALLDAYEEALDLTMYLKQALVERG